jgi:hypothetical protein
VSEVFSLNAVDTDAAIAETAEVLPSMARRRFLTGTFVAGAALFGDLAEADAAGPAGVARTRTDTSILRFDLVLEYLQAGLYTEAERVRALPESTLAWARVVGAHERAHARAIKKLLGPRAIKPPLFDYHGVTEDEQAFIKTAVAFEELTAALLKWQAVRLDSREILAAVATLHSVETRHAAWIRRIVGLQPASRAFDDPAPQQQMAALIRSTRFIASSSPRTSARTGPRFTG